MCAWRCGGVRPGGSRSGLGLKEAKRCWVNSAGRDNEVQCTNRSAPRTDPCRGRRKAERARLRRRRVARARGLSHPTEGSDVSGKRDQASGRRSWSRGVLPHGLRADHGYHAATLVRGSLRDHALPALSPGGSHLRWDSAVSGSVPGQRRCARQSHRDGLALRCQADHRDPLRHHCAERRPGIAVWSSPSIPARSASITIPPIW